MRPMMTDPTFSWLPWLQVIAAASFIAIATWGPWFVP